MSPPRHNRPQPPQSGDAAPPRPLPAMPAELAHELANLLDGGLRNVGLVIRSLTAAGDASAPPGTPGNVPATADDLARLQTTNQAMRQMAALIHQWMQGKATLADTDASLDPQASLQTLGQTVDHAVRLHIPAAMARQIDIRVNLTDPAAGVPAGPVYPILANALRNAIDALGRRAPKGDERPIIQIDGRIEDGFVELYVRDNGPGLSPAVLDEAMRFRFGVTTKPASAPGSHGLGLSLSRQIAHGLGGTIDLRNRATRGAELVLSYPVRSVLSVTPH